MAPQHAPYLVSAVQALSEAGVVSLGDALFAGGSGGAQVAAVACAAGAPGLAAFLTSYRAFLDSCGGADAAAPPSCAGNASLVQALDSVITNTSWLRCEGRLFVQLTAKPAASLGNDTCAGLGGKPKRGEAVSLFASRDDLVAAVVGSSSDGCAYPFRGGLVADALFSAPLPCPDGLPCLRVAAFPPATWAGLALAGNTLPLKRADVYPGRSGAPLPVAAADWLQASVNASAINATVVDALVRLARLDVAAWMSDRAAWTSW